MASPQHRSLEYLLDSGATHVVLLAPDDSPDECLATDGTVRTIEQALREDPLPHGPGCACFYSPRYRGEGALGEGGGVGRRA